MKNPSFRDPPNKPFDLELDDLLHPAAVEGITFQCARPRPESPFPWPRRARNLSIESRLDWRRDQDRSNACSKAALSREHKASKISSTGIGREQPGGLRKAGAASIAHASLAIADANAKLAGRRTERSLIRRVYP